MHFFGLLEYPCNQPSILKARFMMIKILCNSSLLFVAFFSVFANADNGTGVTYSSDQHILAQGRSLFNSQCANCHMLENEAIGPMLGGVTSALSRVALQAFIQNPAAVAASGDPRAGALINRYKVVMPAFGHLKEAEIDSILSYINQQSTEKKLKPLEVRTSTSDKRAEHVAAPVASSAIAIELEDFATIPILPGRPAYKGITLMRLDPRAKGAYFVDELMGILYSLKEGKASPFLDLREYFPRFVFEPGVATGLGSFVLHPAFRKNGIFYTTHAELRHGSPAINENDIPAELQHLESPSLEWVLTEWKMKEVDASIFSGSHREVLRFITPTTAHGSQEINFSPTTNPHDPDYAKLYISCGDGGSFNIKRTDLAGHPRTILGSIMRIDPAGTNSANGQYGIPQDNPFANSSDPQIHKEIFAYGFRNPHRFTWDFAHGKRMIATDIGEANIEEINLIVKGGSYGWGASALEGNMSINPRKDAKDISPASVEELGKNLAPLGQYDHLDGQAIAGGFVYHGPIKVLKNKYIFGDIVSGRLFYMNMGKSLQDKSIYELAIKHNGEITTLKKMANLQRAHLRLAYDARKGDLFLLTKDDGKIRRVVAATLDKSQ